MNDLPVHQILPFPVRVVRWYRSKLNLVQMWSIFSEGWLPILLLFDFTSIGVSVKTAAAIALALKLLNASSSIYLRNVTSDVIGNKDDVAVATAAPDPAPVVTGMAVPS